MIGRAEFRGQIGAERAKAAASVEDQDVIAGPEFDTGGITTIASGAQSGRGCRAAHSAKPDTYSR